VFLIGEREHYLLSGDLYAELCPFIDGKRTLRELTAALEGKLSAPEVLYGVSSLVNEGYLIEVEPYIPTDRAAFWQSLAIDPTTAAQNLANRSITVQALGQFDLAPFIEALRGIGISTEDGGQIQVSLVEDYLMPELELMNRRALEQKRPWMLVKPKGTMSWIGPMFQAAVGPCWACLAQRLRSNRPVETFIQRSNNEAVPLLPPHASLETSVRATLNFAAITIAHWIVNDGRGELNNHLLTIDQGTLKVDRHRVVQRPQCPECGNSELLKMRGLQTIPLLSRAKTFTDDGAHRCADPQETFERYKHHISPITGIISSLGVLPERNHPLRPIYAASHFVIPMTEHPVFDDFQQGSLGKGKTPSQSCTSALCEAIERWSALYQGDEPRIRARFADLRQEAIHPYDLINFSQSQYQTRNERNRNLSDERLAIPLPFDEQMLIDWTPVWSLTQKRHRYVPTAYCYANTPVMSGDQFCRYSSNGHAAGNCLEEALLQGFFELVERDAAAIWWYNRVIRPAVALESFGEPYFLALRDHYLAMGWELWVCDLTTDLKIPAFVALAHQRDTNQFILGLGSHFEARLGIQRALTELNQLYIPGQKQNVPWDQGAIRDQSYLFPDQDVAASTYHNFESRQRQDLLEDVQVCTELATQLGLEILVLDQTRPDIRLSVVKVIVPGLRHVWPRFGPGRLYEVPTRLGWLDIPLSEAQLNPVSLFL
jgi:ribosomal protein S12 methylthiotransferase accessory factor